MQSAAEVKKRRDKRLSVLNKLNSRCAYCGCEINQSNFQVDHIIPKMRKCKEIPWNERGGDEIENLNPSCQSCNASKSTMSVEDFRRHIIDRVHRLNIHSSNYQIAKRFGLIKEEINTIVFYFETITTDAE